MSERSTWVGANRGSAPCLGEVQAVATHSLQPIFSCMSHHGPCEPGAVNAPKGEERLHLLSYQSITPACTGGPRAWAAPHLPTPVPVSAAMGTNCPSFTAPCHRELWAGGAPVAPGQGLLWHTWHSTAEHGSARQRSCTAAGLVLSCGRSRQLQKAGFPGDAHPSDEKRSPAGAL